MSNRQLEEVQEEEAGNRLALELGISYDDLLQLEYEIKENASSDGLIYEYIITFTSDSPREILDRIQGLSGDSVRLAPSSFNEPDEF